jgi:hypothetical protein
VIRCDHCVELAAHRSHEDGISRERTGDASLARRRGEQVHVFTAKPATVTRMRVERAKRDAWLGDSKPPRQVFASDPRGLGDRASVESFGHGAQGDVRRRQNHAEWIRPFRIPAANRREHHRHGRLRELGEHFGVTGIIVSALEQGALVDRRSHDACHVSGQRQLDCTL